MKEKQKQITVYEAFDGREFSVKQECMDYEQKERSKRKVLSHARNIMEYCKENIQIDSAAQNIVICENHDCPFFNNKVKENCILGYPYTWKEL